MILSLVLINNGTATLSLFQVGSRESGDSNVIKFRGLSRAFWTLVYMVQGRKFCAAGSLVNVFFLYWECSTHNTQHTTNNTQNSK